MWRTIRAHPWRTLALVMVAASLCTWRECHRSGSCLTEEQRSLVRDLATRSSVSDRALPVRVAIFHTQIPGLEPTAGVGEVFQPGDDCVWESVGPVEIAAGALDQFDVVIFPGGSGQQQAAQLRPQGRRAVQAFVRAGGGYVGICGGAFLATANYNWSLGLINAKTITGQLHAPDGARIDLASYGAGTVDIEFTPAGRQVFSEVPQRVAVEFAGGPILSPACVTGLPAYVSLAGFRTEVWKHSLQKGTMRDTPAIVAGRFGSGRVIIFSPHPEESVGRKTLVVQAVRAVSPTRHPRTNGHSDGR